MAQQADTKQDQPQPAPRPGLVIAPQIRELRAKLQSMLPPEQFEQVAGFLPDEGLLRRLEMDTALSNVAMRFVDRAGDIHPGIDGAERICGHFYAAMCAELDRWTEQRTARPLFPES